MTDVFRAGDPDAFEISIRWLVDPDPPRERPAGYGWSMGELVLTVAGRVITEMTTPMGSAPGVLWYLAPLLRWVADEWESVFSDDPYSWPEAPDTPASLACRRALDRYVGADDAADRTLHAQAYAWFARHGIRSAAEGGVLPDLFIRRVRDAVEVSWSGEPALFAPDGLVMGDATPGVVLLAPHEIETPLRSALRWAMENPPPDIESFAAGWATFHASVARVAGTHPRRRASAHSGR